MHSDRCYHTSGWECHAKVSRKEAKTQEFVYRDTMSVECEINGHASNIIKATSIVTEGLKKHLEAIPRTHSTDSP